MRTTTSGDAVSLRPALVRWPQDPDRRTRAAAEGRPCLLVIDLGTEPPVPGELEDWVAADANELDVAARLEGLEALARSRPIVARPVATIPDGLAPGDRRLARRLLGAVGVAVPRAQLLDDEVDDATLDRAAERVRRSMVDTPWCLQRVGAWGFVVMAREQG